MQYSTLLIKFWNKLRTLRSCRDNVFRYETVKLTMARECALLRP